MHGQPHISDILCSSLNNVKAITLRRLRGTRRVARMREVQNAYRIFCS